LQKITFGYLGCLLIDPPKIIMLYCVHFSYYTMDAIEMQKHSKNGEYWANASHYLYCSEAHGQAYFYNNISRDLESNTYPLDKLATAYSKSMKVEFIKVKLDYWLIYL
jgi:hypothetical protein